MFLDSFLDPSFKRISTFRDRSSDVCCLWFLSTILMSKLVLLKQKEIQAVQKKVPLVYSSNQQQHQNNQMSLLVMTTGHYPRLYSSFKRVPRRITPVRKLAVGVFGWGYTIIEHLGFDLVVIKVMIIISVKILITSFKYIGASINQSYYLY